MTEKTDEPSDCRENTRILIRELLNRLEANIVKRAEDGILLDDVFQLRQHLHSYWLLEHTIDLLKPFGEKK